MNEINYATWDVAKYLKEQIANAHNSGIDSDVIDDYTHAIKRIEKLEEIWDRFNFDGHY